MRSASAARLTRPAVLTVAALATILAAACGSATTEPVQLRPRADVAPTVVNKPAPAAQAQSDTAGNRPTQPWF